MNIQRLCLWERGGGSRLLLRATEDKAQEPILLINQLPSTPNYSEIPGNQSKMYQKCSFDLCCELWIFFICMSLPEAFRALKRNQLDRGKNNFSFIGWLFFLPWQHSPLVHSSWIPPLVLQKIIFVNATVWSNSPLVYSTNLKCLSTNFQMIPG